MSELRNEEILAAQEFHAHEMDVGDGPWERWYDACEKALGFTLDEDGDVAGYCLDWAYDWYLEGMTVAACVERVMTERKNRGL